MIVPGVAATTGVLEYREPDGSVRRELVTADALEDPSSLVGKPVTLEHPPEGEVNPQNFKEHVVGEVVKARYDAATGRVHVKLRIKDAEAIRAVRSGTKELSPGYKATLIDQSGTHPEHGDFDLKQTDRTNNHLAITEAGRDGPESSIRLDSAGDVVLSTQHEGDQPMAKENEDEETRTDALIDRIQAIEETQQQQSTILQKLDKALGLSASEETGSEESEESEQPAEPDEESGGDGGGNFGDEDEERTDSMDKQERIKWFRERRDALDTADRLDVDVSENASVSEIRRAVVEDQRGDLRNDSEEYVRAAFDLITDELEDEENRTDSDDDPDPFDLDFEESFTPEEPRQDSEENREDSYSGLRPGEEPAQAELREMLSGGGE